MSTNTVKEAIKHFLVTQGLPECEIKLHETASPVSVKFDVDLIQASQMLCWNGRFDLAHDLRTKAESARFFVDPKHGTCFDELVEKPDVSEQFHSDLAATLSTLYLNQFREPLLRAAKVLEAAEEACVGPDSVIVKEIETPGGFTMTLTARTSDFCYVEQYFESGEPEYDWADMVHALEKPFWVFDLACVITDPDGTEIGSDALCRCSANSSSEGDFIKDALKSYGRGVVSNAITEARKAFPRQSRADIAIAA